MLALLHNKTCSVLWIIFTPVLLPLLLQLVHILSNMSELYTVVVKELILECSAGFLYGVNDVNSVIPQELLLLIPMLCGHCFTTWSCVV